jgi:N-acyl-D-aspartate/D-glutamate deacylase
MALFFMMSENDIEMALKAPWMGIGSDAAATEQLGKMDALGLPHPRSYGTFPRLIAEYVRKRGVITLEDAVRKMSSAVADRLSLRDRGLLRQGLLADVVIFDPETIGDRATFEDPHQLSVGVRDVWVNGGRVLENGEHTGAKPGRIVDGPGRK